MKEVKTYIAYAIRYGEQSCGCPRADLFDVYDRTGNNPKRVKDVRDLIAEVERLTVECTELDGFRSALETRIETQREMMAELQSSLTLSREEGRREGMMEGEQLLLCYMIDNCEWETVSELFLQMTYADYLKTAIRSEAKGERG